MAKQEFYATGRRKEAVARVRLRPGSGKITVNHQDVETYFKRETAKMLLRQPLELAGVSSKFDVQVNVMGGGMSGQAGAVRHGLARALCLAVEASHSPLKKAGFLTRDSRMVERKKYGRSGARKRFQFSKR